MFALAAKLRAVGEPGRQPTARRDLMKIDLNPIAFRAMALVIAVAIVAAATVPILSLAASAMA